MADITSPRGLAILEKLPPNIYAGAETVKDLLQSIGVEYDLIREAIDALLDNAFVRTADDWGLERWEEELQLPINPAETDAERQDRIVSRLRGYGTATIAVIEAVTESYAFGDALIEDVHAVPALPDYTIRITFVSEHGIPSNLEDLQREVRAVVPAHLAIEYVFTYITWDEVDAQGWTWDDVDALAMTWDEWEAQEL